MTARTNRSRRGRFSDRMHDIREVQRDGGFRGLPPTERRHAAIPSYPSAMATIVIGTEDACLRCEGPIVLALTGWEHDER